LINNGIVIESDALGNEANGFVLISQIVSDATTGVSFENGPVAKTTRAPISLQKGLASKRRVVRSTRT